MTETKTQDGVHHVYKKIGQTPLEAMEEYRAVHPELAGVSMTYAGRLDPMAEGLLLVLSGDAVHKKDEYLGLPKTYVCKILWGFETDTLDILGLIHPRCHLGDNDRVNIRVPDIFEIQKALEKMIGTFEQKYPVYSSRPVDGKPLFQWAREGRLSEIQIPTHTVELFSARYVSRENISGEQLLADIISNIHLVSGDFRQQETIEKWHEVLAEQKNTQFTVDTIELSVGSGFYVRQFVSDLATALHTTALTYHILRTRVGDFASKYF